MNHEEQDAFSTGLNTLFYASELIEALATAPKVLNEESAAWLVASGSVDIFAVPLRHGQPTGARTHVCRIEANHVVFGLLDLNTEGQDGSDHGSSASQGLLAVPLPNTHWVRVGAARTLLEATSNEGFVLRCLADTWVQALESELRPDTQPGRIAAGAALAQLDALHASVLQRMQKQRSALDAADAALLIRRQSSEAQRFSHAIGGLAQVVPTKQTVSKGGRTGDALLDACQKVVDALGVKALLARPPLASLGPDPDLPEQIEALCRQAKVSQRRVNLDGASWWKDISAPLLAFIDLTAAPVALLPKASGGYVIVDPVTGQETPLTQSSAQSLSRTALMFYRAFDNEVITVAKLARFGLQGTSVDLWRVLVFGVLGGMLGLLTPTATGLLIDSVIQSANTN